VAWLLAGEARALEPNLLEPAVAYAAREGDAALFDALRERFPKEADPATRRRYLLALTAFEDAGLNARARELAFSDAVPMQDVASFVAGLMGNRVGQAAFWAQLRERWDAL